MRLCKENQKKTQAISVDISQNLITKMKVISAEWPIHETS